MECLLVLLERLPFTGFIVLEHAFHVPSPFGMPCSILWDPLTCCVPIIVSALRLSHFFFCLSSGCFVTHSGIVLCLLLLLCILMNLSLSWDLRSSRLIPRGLECPMPAGGGSHRYVRRSRRGPSRARISHGSWGIRDDRYH